METDEFSYEPPAKITKIEVHQHPSLYVKLHFTGLFDVQKAQSVIHSEPSKQRDKTPLRFHQMAFNLSFVAVTEEEFVAINKSIREILDWEPKKIPYLQLLVKNSATRRSLLNRSSTLLASFVDLPPCCIGIRIVLNKRDEEYVQNHHVTELRRILWSFIINELTPIPPHAQIFLSAELKLMTNQDISSTPAIHPTQQSKAMQTPHKSQVKIYAKTMIATFNN